MNRINPKDVIVTTGDLHENYEIVSPVYFQLNNKSWQFSGLKSEYSDLEYELKKTGQRSDDKLSGWFEILFGNPGGDNGHANFDMAFFIAVEELKKRAATLGADAIIGMRQDIDLDSTGFQYFYLQMYGTAVRTEKLIKEIKEKERIIAEENRINQLAKEKEAKEREIKRNNYQVYWEEHKEEKEQLKNRIKELEEQCDPLLIAISDKQDALNKINDEIRFAKVPSYIKKEELRNQVKKLEFKRADCNSFQKKEINRITEEIAQIRSTMPTDEEIEKEKQELRNEKQPMIDEITSSLNELRNQRDSIREQIDNIKEELNRDR